MIDAHHGWNASFKPVTLGFIFSLILLAAVYRIVMHYHLSSTVLITTVLVMGCLQAILQLIFFLHVGLESKPHWNTMMFVCMVLFVLILVTGTVWIMYHLGYNVMPDMNKLRHM